jgi:hypothetical protein
MTKFFLSDGSSEPEHGGSAFPSLFSLLPPVQFCVSAAQRLCVAFRVRLKPNQGCALRRSNHFKPNKADSKQIKVKNYAPTPTTDDQ